MMELDDRTVAVPVGEGAKSFRGVFKLNESAVRIFKLLENATDEAMIVSELTKHYGVDNDIPKYVHEMVEYLQSEGVLEQ